MDIVMIPFHDCKKWISEGFRTRDAHLAEHFCIDRRVGKVLIINRPISLAEMILRRSNWVTKADNLEVILKGKNYQISKLSEKLYCLDTFLPDFLKVAREKKLWWFLAFQNQFILNTIRDAVEFLMLKDTVLLLQNPMAIGAVKSIRNSCFAFDAIDNWLHHPQMSSNYSVIEDSYKYVEGNADVIFTVSEALTNVFIRNKNVNWIANGVDTNYFASAFTKHMLGMPVTVGYVGKIQDRVDFELIEICLKKFKEIMFIFMGPTYSQKKYINRLKNKYNNILFTGDIHYKNLPEAMRKIDIAIIPHKVDDFTNSMNPLKLYEYLAAGKPVVSTQVAGINDISPYVYTSNTRDEFIIKLERVAGMVEQGGINPIKVAESIPEECSWTYRSNNIINILEDAVRGKRNG